MMNCKQQLILALRRPSSGILSLLLFAALLGLITGGNLWAQDRRFFGRDRSNPITFGLEIETDVEVNPKILDYYCPANYARRDWNTLSLGEKKLLIKTAQFHNNPITRIIKNVLLMDPKEREFYRLLPITLYQELSGKLEFNGFIFDDLEELKSFTREFVGRFGPGDIQGHVVFNTTRFDPDGLLGYTIYESDRALIRRLRTPESEQGDQIKGINFISAYLAPITEDKKEKILRVNDHDLKRSGRFSAPILRYDSYHGKLGFELRMEDNPSENNKPYLGSEERLLDAMDRLSYVLQRDGDLKAFRRFSNTVLVDQLNPGHNRAIFERPNGHLIPPEAVQSLEHAYFPLRNWESYLPGLPGIYGPAPDLKNGKKTYVSMLEDFKGANPVASSFTHRTNVLEKITWFARHYLGGETLENWEKWELAPERHAQELIMGAIRSENRDQLRFLFMDKMVQNIDKVISYEDRRESPLMIASEEGRMESAWFLVKAGAQVNQTNINGSTPLMFAAKNGDLELVNLLLARGAQVETLNKFKFDVFHYVQGPHRDSIVKSLHSYLKWEREAALERTSTPSYDRECGRFPVNPLMDMCLFHLDRLELVDELPFDIDVMKLDRKVRYSSAAVSEQESKEVRNLIVDCFPKLARNATSEIYNRYIDGKDLLTVNLGAEGDGPGLTALLTCKEDRDSVLLEKVCVRSSERGKGLGKKLMQAAFKACEKRDNNNKAKPFRLTVLKDNPNAIKLYRQLGFKTTYEITSYMEMVRESD